MCSSTCVGHLECENPHCDYLQRAHRTSSVNDIEIDGFTNEPFPVGGLKPTFSTLVCKICEEPLKCIAPCVAKMFYIHSNDTTQQHAFILATIVTPSRSTIVGIVLRINALIEEHVEQTPQASHSNLFWKPARTLWASSSSAMIVILIICFHSKNFLSSLQGFDVPPPPKKKLQHSNPCVR